MARQPNTSDGSSAAKTAFEEGKKLSERGADVVEAVTRSSLSSASELADRSAGEAKKGMEQLSSRGEAAVRRSQQSLGAAADAGGALLSGAQEISQAWMDLAQARMERMAEGMRALATCRSPADLMKAQGELLQGAMEQMIDTNRRVADVSMRVMQEVTSSVTTSAKVG